MGRRFINHGIEQLEKLVEANPGDARELRDVLDELTHRKTKRAGQLRTRVEQLLRADAPQVVQPSSTVPLEVPKAESSSAKTPEPQAQFASPTPRPPHPTSEATLPRAGHGAVLETWIALEVLSPQSFDRPQDLAPGESSFVVDIKNSQLPWQGGHHGRRERRTFYQVSLGELRLAEAFEAIQRRYADDAPDRRTSQASALLGVVVCDNKGVPQRNRVAISSFGWALSPALEGQLRRLGQWREAELRLQEGLEERLHRTDPEGQPLPLDHAALTAIHTWLVQELRLKQEWVRAPSFAICAHQLLFIQQPPEPLVLNSFFLADLIRAGQLMTSGEAPLALQRYLGAVAAEPRRDVLDDASVLPELLAPAMTPGARWPNRARSPLVTLQQAAVNAAMSSAPGSITAVNGPPGTGKTTLLRDIVAGVVAARAEVMSRFDDPRTAFTKTGLTFTSSGTRVEVHEVDEKLRGFELIVASSNNGAVENVSRELPRIEAVAPAPPSPRYFSSVATAIAGEECWGLVAAVLGNSSNRYQFWQSFWADEDRGMNSYLSTAAGLPMQLQDASSNAFRAPTVVTREQPPTGPAEAQSRWKVARQRFQAALTKSRSNSDRLQRVHVLETEASQQRQRLEQLAKELAQLSSQRSASEQTVAEAKFRHQTKLEVVLNAKQRRAAHLIGRPNLFARLFRTQAARAWQAIDQGLLSDVGSANAALLAEDSVLGLAELSLSQTNAAAAGVLQRQERAQSALAEATRQLAAIDPGIRERSAWRLSATAHEARQRATSWFDEHDQRARDELFVAAMDLHRAFVDAAAEPLRQNITAFFRHLWTGVPRATPKHVRDLWTSLSLVVPVLSTTFASVEKMFRDLGPASLGWLLLDESGQATPQSAVGAIVRANRVIVVGDPLQIEPVVTLPQPLVQGICAHIGVAATEYAAPFVSAQVFADRASPFGASYQTREGSRQVGLPLLVHRRCADPMFSISNQVAYANLMVQATPSRESAIGKVLGPSRWIQVEGAATNRHWSGAEGDVLLDLLRQLARAKVDPALFIVSPFRAVAENARTLVRRAPELARYANDLQTRIGTVHTVQGREAEAVIFVLGAPDDAQFGARTWAGVSPNLLNVAVTRAQQRLYVIGNRRHWSRAGLFSHLAARLPSDS